MRVYKIYPEKWALEALKRQRLKIATLRDLNDPFEFLHATSRNPVQRRLWHAVSTSMFKQNGLISFSKNWENPVLWSHYADCHKGAALGFDVSDRWIRAVKYRKTRMRLPDLKTLNDNQRLKLLKLSTHTKFNHWSYEEELRLFVKLDVSENGLFFKDFDDDTVLREVIIGAKSTLTSKTINEAYSSSEGLSVTTARLAFHSFRVVPQKKQALRK